MSALSMIVTHQNVPVGTILTEQQLAAAMRAGTVELPDITPEAQALILSIFRENHPGLILRAAAEVGVTAHQVHALYREYLQDCPLPIRAWERAMRGLGA